MRYLIFGTYSYVFEYSVVRTQFPARRHVLDIVRFATDNPMFGRLLKVIDVKYAIFRD